MKLLKYIFCFTVRRVTEQTLSSLQKQNSIADALPLSQPDSSRKMHSGVCLSGLLQCKLLHAGFFYHYLLDKNGTVWCMRNVLARLLVTTIYMAIITLIAAMIPFFGCVPHFLSFLECSKCPRG